MTRRTAEPTYSGDIIGDIARFDECDTVFARGDLFDLYGEGSPEFEAYYGRHPEKRAYDARVHNMPGIGRHSGFDEPMFQLQFDMATQIGTESFVDGDPAPQKAEMSPERAAQTVKAMAHLFGADLVGVGPLRQEWVHSHVGRSRGEGYAAWGTPVDLSHHTNAVAIGTRMQIDLVKASPNFPALLATARGYALGAFVAVQLADYIRRLGYAARAHHMANYRVLVVPVAVDCGLGELSRAGFLLTKAYGLAVRLAAVTTDMPLAHDGPVDIGVQAFCDVCKICAESCPIGAIPYGGKVVHNGVKKWKLDEEKCYLYWHSAGTDCGLCLASCPWTNPPTRFHKFMAEFAAVAGPHQRLMTLAHKLIYGKYKPKPGPDYVG